MFTIRRTRDYADWIKKLKDFRAQARIADRIDRLAAGNPWGRKAGWRRRE